MENLNASVEFYHFGKLVKAHEEPFHLFSDHLGYSAWVGLDFSHWKFSAKQPTSAEPALLLRNKSAGFQTIRKGIPTAGELP